MIYIHPSTKESPRTTALTAPGLAATNQSRRKDHDMTLLALCGLAVIAGPLVILSIYAAVHISIEEMWK